MKKLEFFQGSHEKSIFAWEKAKSYPKTVTYIFAFNFNSNLSYSTIFWGYIGILHQSEFVRKPYERRVFVVLLFYCMVLKVNNYMKFKTALLLNWVPSVLTDYFSFLITVIQGRYYNNVRFFSKLLKTHFFVMQIFCSHFGSFFCVSNFIIIFSNILQHGPQ